jgi:hypothetical protein
VVIQALTGERRGNVPSRPGWKVPLKETSSFLMQTMNQDLLRVVEQKKRQAKSEP